MRSYTISDLAAYLGLANRGLYEKAQRQQWPVEEMPSQRGKPTFTYTFDTLPNEVQEAWAAWDERKYQKVVEQEKTKGDGRPDAVPQPVTWEQAKEALTWPERTTYYKTITPPGYIKGPKPKVYDGVSRGLCPAARKILLERFPELKSITPGVALQPSTVADSENQTVREQPRTWSPPPLTQQLPDSIRELRLLEKLLDEKDKRIELLEKQLITAESREKDLVDQLRSLQEKFDRTLKIQLNQESGMKIGAESIQKREPLPRSKGNSTPSPA